MNWITFVIGSHCTQPNVNCVHHIPNSAISDAQVDLYLLHDVQDNGRISPVYSQFSPRMSSTIEELSIFQISNTFNNIYCCCLFF